MQITKTSPLTGQVNTREIDVTKEQLIKWMAGEHIQNVMPHLDKDDREFIMTGHTPEDWKRIFPEEEE